MSKPGGTNNAPSAVDEFRKEFAVVWAAMPRKAAFLGLLGAWLVLFEFLGNSTFGYVATPSLFQWMHNAYNFPGSDDSHGNLIPFAVIALFWWKRDLLMGVEKRVWWPAACCFLLAAGMHVLGYAVQQPLVSVVALFTGVYAILAWVWGWRFALSSLFPFALFAFSVPLSAVLNPVTIPLRQLSTDLSVFIIRQVLGIQIVQQGVQILDSKGAYSYEVAAACSGIRSLLMLLALATVYAFITFGSTWKRAVIVASSVPIALGGNCLRLVAIVVASEAFGQKAGEFVHEWFGFVTFAVALGAMFGLSRLMPEDPPMVGAQRRVAA